MKNYLSLVKFSHTIFALPFALIGFFLAFQTTQDNSNFSTTYWVIKLLLILVCMLTARNAAMAFNRYIDRKYDEKNPRTAIREIPAGIITPKNALWFIIINCLIFIIATYFINKLCFYLSFVALAVVLGYSLTKRFTFLCHIVLGIGLALAPIGAYLAVTGKFNVLPLMFSFAVLFWVSGFDIIYALQDEQFDRENNLYSIPSYFGQDRAKWISRTLHFFSMTCLVYAGILGQFHFMYWTGICIFAILLIYQHSLIIRFGLQKVDLAFFTTNGIASILFAICTILDLLLLN
jgi:4-hydroxybenzoate polyprenyltransferase